VSSKSAHKLEFRHYRGLDESGRLDLGAQRWPKVNRRFEGQLKI